MVATGTMPKQEMAAYLHLAFTTFMKFGLHSLLTILNPKVVLHFV